MADESVVPQSSEAPQETTTATLDDVYKEFNVEEVASNFSPAPQRRSEPAPQRVEDAIPDPILDPQGFKSYQARHAATVQHTGKELSEIAGAVKQMMAEQARTREKQEISAAVQKIKESGFDADDNFIEIALGVKAREDSRFLSVYANRNKNPAAWNKALSAMANEMKGKYQFRSDPNLAANVRAAKNSTQVTQTTAQESAGNSLDKHFAGLKSPGDFDKEWQRLVNGGVY